MEEVASLVQPEKIVQEGLLRVPFALTEPGVLDQQNFALNVLLEKLAQDKKKHQRQLVVLHAQQGPQVLLDQQIAQTVIRDIIVQVALQPVQPVQTENIMHFRHNPLVPTVLQVKQELAQAKPANLLAVPFAALERAAQMGLLIVLLVHQGHQPLPEHHNALLALTDLGVGGAQKRAPCVSREPMVWGVD